MFVQMPVIHSPQVVVDTPIQGCWSRYDAELLHCLTPSTSGRVSARSSAVCVADGYGNLTGLVSAANLSLAGARLLIVNTLNPACNKPPCVARLPLLIQMSVCLLPSSALLLAFSGCGSHVRASVTEGSRRQLSSHSRNPFGVKAQRFDYCIVDLLAHEDPRAFEGRGCSVSFCSQPNQLLSRSRSAAPKAAKLGTGRERSVSSENDGYDGTRLSRVSQQ